MTNHTLEKAQWLVATPLTFGNPLKFCLDFRHNAKGRPTFLHWERERESTRSSTRTTMQIDIERGSLIGPRARGSCRHCRRSNKGPRRQRQFFHCHSRLRPGIDTIESFPRVDFDSIILPTAVESSLLQTSSNGVNIEDDAFTPYLVKNDSKSGGVASSYLSS